MTCKEKLPANSEYFQTIITLSPTNSVRDEKFVL